MTERVAKSKSTTRRKFLAGAALTGAAAVAMPQVSRAQTATLKMQTSWPATDIFTEMAKQYVTRVNEMAGGRLKIDLLNARRRGPRRSRCWTGCMAGRSTPPIP